jgi:putative ABC transport system substrate-binding protein
MLCIRRREFITLLGSAAACPLAVHAQQDGRIRRVGVLLNVGENDPAQANLATLRGELARLGWIEGRNLRIDTRFGSGDLDRIRAAASELVNLEPEVIVTSQTAVTRSVQQQTGTIPIVIMGAGDPVINGLVTNIARPEGNTTGFINFEPSMAGKWLELLKEAAPHVTRVAVVHNPDLRTSAIDGYISLIEAAAAPLGVRATTISYRSAVEIVRGIDAFASVPNGGLILLPPSLIRATILELAAQYRLPAIYPARAYAAAGGLMAYAPDSADLIRRVATYVDQVLRGAKVNELPIQFPTKFQLVVNLKTAKAMGLTFPTALLIRADEVIE